MSFYKNFMLKQRTISPFRPALPFLEKIFHPNPYCQIRGSQFPPAPHPPPPFYKWVGEGGGFRAKYSFFIKKIKPKVFIVVWLSLYSSFFFFFHFTMFLFLSVFFSFFNVFCNPPPNQENYDSRQIPLKYDINTRL